MQRQALASGGVEDAEVGTGREAPGGGGRGTRWWRGRVRRKRKRRSLAGIRRVEEAGAQGRVA
jgi:hypothetical protein